MLRRFLKFVAGQYRWNVSTWFLVKAIEFNKIKFNGALATTTHRWGVWLTLRLGRFTPEKGSVPIVWEAGWAPTLVWRVGKISPLGFNPWTVQSVAL